MSSRSDHGVRMPTPSNSTRRKPGAATSLPSGLPHYELLREFRKDADHPLLWHHAVLQDDNLVPRLAESSPPPFQPIDLREVLDVPGPWEIEICTGKGRFLCEYATLHPERGILGVEWTRPIAWYAADKLQQCKVEHHTRILWGDGLYFLRDRLPAGICQAFHIYFPDPWPRNKDRRVLRADLLAQFRRLAVPGCVLHWATDHEEYNTSACALLERTEGFSLVQANAPPTEGIRTGFESKYLAEGRPIYRSIWSVEPQPS